MTTPQITLGDYYFAINLNFILCIVIVILLNKLYSTCMEINYLRSENRELRSENRQLHDQLYQQRRRPFISNIVPGGIEKVYVSKRVATYSYYDEPGTSQPGSF